MSISSEITRLSGNVSSAFGTVSQMGGTVPSGANSDDLATSIRSIPQSGGTSDAFWVDALLDLQTLQLSNVSHTYSEILAAHQTGKIVKIRLSYYMSQTVHETTIGDLRTYIDSSNWLVFDALIAANLGNGMQVYHYRVLLYDDNTTTTQLRLLNSTQIV